MIRILSGAALTLFALALLLAMTVDAIAAGLFLSLASYAALLAGMLLAAIGAASLPRGGHMTDEPDRDQGGIR